MLNEDGIDSLCNFAKDIPSISSISSSNCKTKKTSQLFYIVFQKSYIYFQFYKEIYNFSIFKYDTNKSTNVNYSE